MKMIRATCLACLSLGVSLVLHGCASIFEPADSPAPPAPPPPAPVAKPMKRAVCQCGKRYGCQGGSSWCEQMEKVCGNCKKNCEPQCAWSCESPKCSQTCGPKCKAPSCSVRCKGFNTKSCRMECGKPNCRVVCPKEPYLCAAKNCAKCKTECSKPVCQVACKKGIGDEQPCRNVCSQPVCHWDCKQPTVCPKPKCSMKCEKAQDCMADSLVAGETPPLEPGETEVATVEVPMSAAPAPGPAASFLQSSSGSAVTMRVNFTSMNENRSLQTGHVDLALMQVDASDFAGNSWVREVREEDGEEREVEASCNNGEFKCRGDEAWCVEQKDLICKGSDMVFPRHRSHAQNHLQA